MRWSWKVTRLAGIELRVHATFLILLAWLALAFYRSTGAAGALGGVLFTLALFASVVLHELGHALVARRFGVPTRDITLLPIGGVARLERIPEEPRQELWIALAGPAVTTVVVAALYLLTQALALPVALPTTSGVPASDTFVAQLMWVNVTLLVFNLLPAFPMDGGRVLRALLARRMDYLRATEVASRVGRTFALLFGVIGMLYDPILLLIAFFVWFGATGEAAGLLMRSTLAGVHVEQVMIRDLRTLGPDDTLDTALQHVLAGFQQDFPVVEDDRVVGVLTRAALLRELARHGRETRVQDAMERSFRSAEPREPLDRAVARLGECRCQTMPVLSDGHLRGVLTLENVGEFVAIAGALRASAAGHAA